MADVRKQLRDQLRKAQKDTAPIESELSRLRSEQRNLAKALAAGGDGIPEIVTAMRQRNDRIKAIEAELAAAKRTPEMVSGLLAEVETSARARPDDLRAALGSDRQALRDALRALFPDGLVFTQADGTGARRVWEISGVAQLAGSSNRLATPTGSSSK